MYQRKISTKVKKTTFDVSKRLNDCSVANTKHKMSRVAVAVAVAVAVVAVVAVAEVAQMLRRLPGMLPSRKRSNLACMLRCWMMARW